MNKNDNILVGAGIPGNKYKIFTNLIQNYNINPDINITERINNVNNNLNKFNLGKLSDIGITNTNGKYNISPAGLNKNEVILSYILQGIPYSSKSFNTNDNELIKNINKEITRQSSIKKLSDNNLSIQTNSNNNLSIPKPLEEPKLLENNNTSQTKNNKELIEDYIIRINKEIENINSKNKELEAYLIKLQIDKNPININGGRIKKIKSIKIQKRKSPKQKKI
jgi:hypothetical protein